MALRGLALLLLLQAAGEALAHALALPFPGPVIGMALLLPALQWPWFRAPVQAKVITISEEQAAYGEKILAGLRAAGLRVEADFGPDKLGAKIREASQQKIPYLLILGAKEAEAGTVSVRIRGGVEKQGVALDGFVETVRKEIAERSQNLTV